MLPRIRIRVPASITAAKLRTRAPGLRRAALIVGYPATQALDLLALAFVIQPALARAQCRAGLVALFWLDAGARDQLLQTLQCRATIALLGAVIARLDQQRAVGIQPAAGQRAQPRLHRRAQRIGAGQVKAQLGGGRDLVDVLATRSRAAHELELQILFGDGGDMLQGGSPRRSGGSP